MTDREQLAQWLFNKQRDRSNKLGYHKPGKCGGSCGYCSPELLLWEKTLDPIREDFRRSADDTYSAIEAIERLKPGRRPKVGR